MYIKVIWWSFFFYGYKIALVKWKKKLFVLSFVFNLNLIFDFIDLVNKNWLFSDIIGNGVDIVDRIVCYLNCIELL